MAGRRPSAGHLAVHHHQFGVELVPEAGRVVAAVRNGVERDQLVAERSVPDHALRPHLDQQAAVRAVRFAVHIY